MYIGYRTLPEQVAGLLFLNCLGISEENSVERNKAMVIGVLVWTAFP